MTNKFQCSKFKISKHSFGEFAKNKNQKKCHAELVSASNKKRD
jgi:hypothetical protein